MGNAILAQADTQWGMKFSEHAAQSQVAWLRGPACSTTSTSKTRFGERCTAGWKSRLRSSNLSILAKDSPCDWRWQCDGAEWTLQFHGSYSGRASVAPGQTGGCSSFRCYGRELCGHRSMAGTAIRRHRNSRATAASDARQQQWSQRASVEDERIDRST